MEFNMLFYTLVFLLSTLECSYSEPVSFYRRRREVACKSTAANLNDAIGSVSSVQEVRDDIVMQMKPFVCWEEFLLPLPISIAILGELAVLSSSGGDFSINLNPPTDGYKYMKYPKSFAASLMQVCNSAWFAFNTANKNMDQIRLLSGFIPSANAEIVKILSTPTASVANLLPKKLNSLLLVSKKCTSLAQSVELGFNETVSIIHELLEACLNSMNGYEHKLTDIKTALEQLSLKEASSRKSMQTTEELRKATETQLKDAIEAYKNAMDKVPSVMETAGADILGTFLNPSSNIAKKDVKQDLDVDGTRDTSNGKSIFCSTYVCARSDRMAKLADSLLNVLDSKHETVNMKHVYDERDHKILTDFFKDLLLDLRKDISDYGNCTAKMSMDTVLQNGIAICEELHRAATSATDDQENLKSIAQKINTLYVNSLKPDTECKAAKNAPAFQQIPPNLSKAVSSGGVGTQAAQRAWATVEQARLQLNNTQALYLKTFDNLKKENQKLTEVLVEIRSHKVEKIDFETTKTLLIKGLSALQRVKEQWNTMVTFFNKISNLLETCLSRNVNELVENAESLQSSMSYTAESFVKDLLFMQATKATNLGYLVNMISSTYSEVSQHYLMDRVNALGIFLGMNPSDPEFKLEHLKLQTGCEDAQRAITSLAISKKQEFDLALEARIERIKCQLGKAIPPLSEKERKSISEAVNEGGRTAGDSKISISDMADFM
ncbi:uncharacterized protein LOC144819251 [Lissotriton helveticus]